MANQGLLVRAAGSRSRGVGAAGADQEGRPLGRRGRLLGPASPDVLQAAQPLLPFGAPSCSQPRPACPCPVSEALSLQWCLPQTCQPRAAGRMPIRSQARYCCLPQLHLKEHLQLVPAERSVVLPSSEGSVAFIRLSQYNPHSCASIDHMYKLHGDV